MTLPAETTISFVRLNVRDLEAMRSFYTQLLGFRVVDESQSVVRLSPSGAPPAILILESHPEARQRSVHDAGLFHLAYLFPDQASLAQTFLHLYKENFPFQGFADHGVSEALYLADPEGNGIELYADRPRSAWRYRNGTLEMVTNPLDLEDLLGSIKGSRNPDSFIHPGVQIGHIHLQVSDLARGEWFYHTLVGFDVVQRSYPGALFLSAGGYHHHIGLNIWNSRGRTAPPEGTLGLASFGIALPSADALERVKARLLEVDRPVEATDNRSFTTKDLDGITVTIHLLHQSPH